MQLQLSPEQYLFKQMEELQDSFIKEIYGCISRFHNVPLGHDILSQGDRPDNLYLVAQGSISESLITVDGRCFQLGEVSCHNHLFGEIEFFTQRPYQWSITAEDNIKVGIIAADNLLRLLQDRPEFSSFFLVHLASDYQISLDICTYRIMHSISYNIAYDLLLQYQGDSPVRPLKNINHEAERFGTSARAYRRVINDLINKDIITKSKSTIEIKDISLLKAYLETSK